MLIMGNSLQHRRCLRCEIPRIGNRDKFTAIGFERSTASAIVGIYAPKAATRVDAIRSDRAAIEFRGLPPSSVAELKQVPEWNEAPQNTGSSPPRRDMKVPSPDTNQNPPKDAGGTSR